MNLDEGKALCIGDNHVVHRTSRKWMMAPD